MRHHGVLHFMRRSSCGLAFSLRSHAREQQGNAVGSGQLQQGATWGAQESRFRRSRWGQRPVLQCRLLAKEGEESNNIPSDSPKRVPLLAPQSPALRAVLEFEPKSWNSILVHWTGLQCTRWNSDEGMRTCRSLGGGLQAPPGHAIVRPHERCSADSLRFHPAPPQGFFQT